MKLAHLLEHSAALHPGRVAITQYERSITFGRLWQAVRRLETYLSDLALPGGSRIAVLWENSIEYAIAYFAVTRANHVIVPLDTSANPLTVNSILSDAEVRVLICQARYQRHLPKILGDNSPLEHIVADRGLKVTTDGIAQHAFTDILGDISSYPENADDASSQPMTWDNSPDDLAAVFYTSGSTGAAKGVMLSHRNLVSNTLATVEYLKLAADDSVMVILPFYYIYGNSLLLTHVACGGRLVVDNRFLYPEVILDAMEAEKVTGFSGVPSNFIILLNNSSFARRDLASLRYFTQAGGAMAPEITGRLMEAFDQKEIYIMYGQTEAGPRATWLPPERLEEKLGSIGIPVPGVKISIVDNNGQEVPPGESGEIVISGPNVMLGYWKQPEETESVLRDGQLLTGDLGRMDTDGYTFVVGRKKEIIKTGGNRVSAKEVEECLLKDERILEATVIGIPDDLLGEAIKAVVVLRNGCEATGKDIQDHCKRLLAVHKAPKFVQFIDTLPKYQSGKINKQLLLAGHD